MGEGDSNNTRGRTPTSLQCVGPCQSPRQTAIRFPPGLTSSFPSSTLFSILAFELHLGIYAERSS